MRDGKMPCHGRRAFQSSGNRAAVGGGLSEAAETVLPWAAGFPKLRKPCCRGWRAFRNCGNHPAIGGHFPINDLFNLFSTINKTYMLDSIDLRGLRNSEFVQFGTDVSSIVKLNDPQALGVLGQYSAFLSANAAVEALFNKEQASAATDELVALDHQRDNLINGINALVLGYTYSADEAQKKNALLLQANISSYGAGIAKENYQSETAIITNLLDDWTTKPELAAAIVALNLTGWQTQLAAANAAFNAKYLARTQEMGSAPPDSLKEKRALATNDYYKLRDFINSYFTINNGAAPFAKVTNELNALIAQYNNLVAGRGKGTPPPSPAPSPAK
jgi:Family of unknown function (DUF6261)